MQPKLPDGYAVEYVYDVQLSNRPPTRYDTECVETMVIYADVFPVDENGVQKSGLQESYQGKAIQNPRDTYSIHLGREIALGRALKEKQLSQTRIVFEVVPE